MKTVMKVLTALAAVAGAVYVVATYGDKIVAWAKSIIDSCPFCSKEEDFVVEEETAEEAPVEEACEEAAPAEEACEEAAPVEEAEPVEDTPADIVIEENEPVAEENDFEG